jgi:hypothetical protein
MQWWQKVHKLLGLVHFLRSTNEIAPICYLRDLFTVEDMGKALVAPS